MSVHRLGDVGPLVTAHWIPGATTPGIGDAVRVVVDDARADARTVSLLTLDAGVGTLALAPQRAQQLGVVDGEQLAAAEVEQRLAAAGIVLHDADLLHFLPLTEQQTLRAENVRDGVRRLTPEDADAFAAFVARAPEDDLDDAYVELDHWRVFGAFHGDDLVAAASMYPFEGTRLADLGVITLPEHRGAGWARATVRALSAQALAEGYEPQYRCQRDNAASIALARAAGFVVFGEWQVLDD